MKTLGVRHAGETTISGTDAVFEIGSLTKLLTGALLALLVEDGVVALDDPVARHLPVAPPVQGRPITLEDLATHRSGLPRVPRKLERWDRRDPYAQFTADRMPDVIARTAPKAEPGGRVAYSNYGYGLLGFALGHAASSTYGELIRTRLTDPLAMTRTGLDTPGLVQGHTFAGRPTPPWNLAALAGAGGLRSTASDVLRFLTSEPARASLAWFKAPGGHGLLMHDGGTGGFRSFALLKGETAVVALHDHARRINGAAFKALKTAEGSRPGRQA
ncbi:beta-lactamase family protein [Solirubrobacter phytolaccae]|uniref:Beta-lactamase family protein n=1 Tax=Solirubrobacter phytolaccae TaxID=1404360 RepID=A0A9X3N7U9_9ACTN|nr:serine hydrolase domain-containing protein [Solirubrobacter phytolaccae]MDA0180009.1 beta-lactamase family protein [Solirubrobacter phytolaccae]